MDETEYGSATGTEVVLISWCLIPALSLIGRPRRTLDCRHGGTALAATPGARRREYSFFWAVAPVALCWEERDGDVASAMRGTGRASEGNRGLPANRIRPEGQIGARSVPDRDARPYGVVGVALRCQGHACGDGGDGRLLETGLACAVPRFQTDPSQRLAYS